MTSSSYMLVPVSGASQRSSGLESVARVGSTFYSVRIIITGIIFIILGLGTMMMSGESYRFHLEDEKKYSGTIYGTVTSQTIKKKKDREIPKRSKIPTLDLLEKVTGEMVYKRIDYTYSVNDTEYTGFFETKNQPDKELVEEDIKKLIKDDRLTIFYNPKRPSESIAQRYPVRIHGGLGGFLGIILGIMFISMRNSPLFQVFNFIADISGSSILLLG